LVLTGCCRILAQWESRLDVTRVPLPKWAQPKKGGAKNPSPRNAR